MALSCCQRSRARARAPDELGIERVYISPANILSRCVAIDGTYHYHRCAQRKCAMFEMGITCAVSGVDERTSAL